jgi:membrane protease YdiL (CAAX protease family)
VGLLVAWGGTALLASPVGRLLGNQEKIATKCREQVALWILFGMVIANVVLWEKQPLESLWLRPLEWSSLAWGLALAVATIWVVIPAREWVRRQSGLGGYPAGMAKVLALPMWFRIAAVITAGIVEETLFNGYAVTRLASLTGHVWLAGILSAAVFAALHIPFWGTGPGLAFFVGGVASTAFFIWRQDLLAMVVAHIAVDAWGIVVTPLYSEWWKDRRFSS